MIKWNINLHSCNQQYGFMSMKDVHWNEPRHQWHCHNTWMHQAKWLILWNRKLYQQSYLNMIKYDNTHFFEGYQVSLLSNSDGTPVGI